MPSPRSSLVFIGTDDTYKMKTIVVLVTLLVALIKQKQFKGERFVLAHS